MHKLAFIALTISDPENALLKSGVKDLTHPVALAFFQHGAILTGDVILRKGSLKIRVVSVSKPLTSGCGGAACSVVTCVG